MFEHRYGIKLKKRSTDTATLKLLREFDKAGIETELFEESRHTPAPWQTEPMSREYLKNILQRGREIARQTLEDVERETVGYISPDAKNDIDKEISEMQEEDAEDSIGI